MAWLSFGNLVTAGKLGYSAWNTVTASEWRRKRRDRRLVLTLNSLHLDFVHSARKLCAQIALNAGKDHLAVSNLAYEVCSRAQATMRIVSGSSNNHLHCCLKMVVDDGADNVRVATWARSEPFDGRPHETGDQNAHAVGTNSVWSCLLGRSDGLTVWQPEFTCFACNDLLKQGARFRCDRANWQNYYQSALVFPLRYAQTIDGSTLVNVGFLAFDTPKPNGFPGLPNIYDYVGRSAEYLDELHKSPLFHLGASFADIIGMLLRPTFEQTLD